MSAKKAAKKTKGNYFKATDLNSLADIYQRIDTLEPQNEQGNVVQEIRELFYIPLLVALLLIALLVFIPRSKLNDWFYTKFSFFTPVGFAIFASPDYFLFQENRVKKFILFLGEYLR